MKTFLLTLAAIATLLLSLGAYAADPAKGRALVAHSNCVACHGADLNAPANPNYPKLAGQYADYLYAAMRAYQIGRHHQHFGRRNPVMAAQVQNLSQRDLCDIAAYIESLAGDLVAKE